MGKAARQRVLDEYLPPRYLTRYIELIDRVAGSAAEQRSYGSAIDAVVTHTEPAGLREVRQPVWLPSDDD